MEITQVEIEIVKGIRYIGSLYDGLFHGSGVILFDNGGKYKGLWKNGEHISGTYVFPDGLIYSESDWDYCTLQDRRFWIEIKEGLNYENSVYETAVQPTPHLLYNCYDVGDGIYYPEVNTINDYENKFLRIPTEEERKWIFEFCRRGLIENHSDETIQCMKRLVTLAETTVDSQSVLEYMVNVVEETLMKKRRFCKEMEYPIQSEEDISEIEEIGKKFSI